jgi:hypothetical protein
VANFDVLGDLFEARTDASEAWVLLSGDKEEYEGSHHSMLPNYKKLVYDS